MADDRCTSCASKLSKEDFYCRKCGSKTEVKRTMNLDQFTETRKRKMNQSQKREKSKKTASSSSTSTNPKNSVVEINIGIASIEEKSSILKKRQGRMSLRVSETIDRHDLLEAAITKYSRFNQNFCANDEYVLLYPDLSEVIFNPGTHKTFRLNEYKEDFGRSYAKVTFFLCQKCDFDEIESLTLPTSRTKQKPVIAIEENGRDDHHYNQFEVEDDIFQSVNPNLVLPRSRSCTPPPPPHSCTPPPRSCTPPPRSCTPPPPSSVTPRQQSPPRPSNLASNPVDPVDPPSNPVDPVDPPSQFKDPETLKEKMAQLKVIFEELPKIELLIRRRCIYVDTIEKLQLHWADEICPFTVKFIGEEVSEGDGVMREFFSLFFEDAQRHILVTGQSGQYSFLHSFDKLRSKEFSIYGNLIAMALLSGCAGPRCLLKEVVCKIFDVEGESNLTINDIPDLDIMLKLDEINSSTADDFGKNVENFTERFSSGVVKREISFEEKEDFIKDIVYHYCISSCIEEIKQVSNGIDDIFGLKSILLVHFDEISEEFLLPSKQKSHKLLEVFTNIKYNEQTKTQEMDIFYNFTSFVASLDTKDYKFSLEIPGKKEKREVTVNLREVIRFCTGSYFVLESMKNQGTVEFPKADEKSHGTRAESGTCLFMLKFPLTQRYSSSSAEFIKNFGTDIVESPGFGKA